MVKLKLKKFNISTIKDDKTIVLIGRRDTGKSFIIKDLLYFHRNIPIGTVLSATESANKFYSYMVPSLFIHDEYTPQIIENVVNRQKTLIDKCSYEIALNGSTKIDPRAFLIMDDCMFDNRWTKDVNIRELFMNGRHWKVLFVITMQYPLGMPPILRTNIDYVFILREQYISNRKRIYDNFAGMFPNFETFCSVMDQCTENYECLVINNNAKSNKLEDQVFWYKAEPHEDFRIGAKEFWDMHQEYFNDSPANGKNELFDVSTIKNKKGPVISVEKSDD